MIYSLCFGAGVVYTLIIFKFVDVYVEEPVKENVEESNFRNIIFHNFSKRGHTKTKDSGTFAADTP